MSVKHFKILIGRRIQKLKVQVVSIYKSIHFMEECIFGELL